MPSINRIKFLSIHYAYIISWTLFASVLIYVLGGISYIDALLLASGAATQSGLNPVNLDRLSISQQVVLWAVAMVTNVVFVNSLLVLFRLCWFPGRSWGGIPEAKMPLLGGVRQDKGYGTIERMGSCEVSNKAEIHGPVRYQTRIESPWQSLTVSSDWDEDELDVEYRALKALLFILFGYFVMFHLIAASVLALWIRFNPFYGELLMTNGIDRSWWAIFTASSAFNDLGYTLTADSMASFRGAALPLIVMTFLIVIGNTGFPCMLRFIIWMLSKVTPRGGSLRKEVRFLLDRPRGCFMLLFPAADTWRLVGVLGLLNVVDLVIFIALDHYGTPGIQILNGVFQIASTRTAGFTIASLRDLCPAVQVSFVVMMYISAFPTAATVRKTDTYKGGMGDADMDVNSPKSLIAHIQDQLGFDIWYIFLGIFLIAIAEGRHLHDHTNQDVSLFAILFEVVSAYGTVGLSLGYPGTETGLCAQFGVMSKIVLVAMQVRGRHRGLSKNAVIFPGLAEGREDSTLERERLLLAVP
ncbi:low affinity potassium transporter [Aspergillus wentii]|nr:low affinity potassium transporter [Aspergillus wentii]